MTSNMAQPNTFAAIANGAQTDPPLTTRNKQERELLLQFRQYEELMFNRPRIMVIQWTGATLVLLDTSRVR